MVAPENAQKVLMFYGSCGLLARAESGVAFILSGFLTLKSTRSDQGDS
jgi:hypothetical protein